MTSQTQPTKSYRTFALILLTIVYGFNFIDRQIVGILAPFIQKDLGLTNTELGLLIGLAFAIFYTLVAIPIAWLADRYNRVNILSIALATWSGFTALTGLAGNFIQIGIARMGVGIGEAGGSPPSHSIISDMYPKEERASALGVYSMGIPLGIMAAYFATAMLMGSSGEDVNWRRIFIFLGLTGVALDPSYDFQTLVIILGIVNGTTYAGGAFFGARLADKWGKKDIRAYGWLPAISIALCLPIGIAAWWSSSIEINLVFTTLFLLFMGVYLGPSFAIASFVTPITASSALKTSTISIFPEPKLRSA